ncbi:MAG: cysteine dioxygenase family protein [Solirubrobacterales bacterium]|nr:cysteine dioxygenase family protein [Solirubrobacterales bacterium]
MSLTDQELTQLVSDIANDPSRWEDQVSHDPEQRSYTLLQDDADVSVWLICWGDGHDTGFHDHDVSAAAITVIAGAVREDRLRLNGAPGRRTARAGETFTVPPNAIHRVQHTGDVPSVTIHAYSPPLVRTGAYEIAPDGELRRESQDGSKELVAA